MIADWMPTNKEKVTFICDLKTKNELERWADEEGRTISSLVGSIVLDAIATRDNTKNSKPEPESKPYTIHELVRQNINKLRRHTGIKNLKQIGDGEVLPTAVDFAKIVALLEIPEEEQKTIWQNTFNPSRQEGIGNGCT